MAPLSTHDITGKSGDTGVPRGDNSVEYSTRDLGSTKKMAREVYDGYSETSSVKRRTKATDGRAYDTRMTATRSDGLRPAPLTLWPFRDTANV